MFRPKPFIGASITPALLGRSRTARRPATGSSIIRLYRRRHRRLRLCEAVQRNESLAGPMGDRDKAGITYVQAVTTPHLSVNRS